MGLHFAVAVSSQTTVWPADASPQPPDKTGKSGRPASRFVAQDGTQPVSIVDLANQAWDNGHFRSVTWRQGTKGAMPGNSYPLRVRSAEKYAQGA